MQLKHDGARFLIISGPNAGGKSVAMKTIGLLQYMLQCGFPVTAEESSEFGLFDSIFLDIGDSQSLENDLSTYSSRLTAMKYFSEMADRHTLVLMDEFGTGTEPQFGGAIAEALLNRLVRQSAYGVITTHYANIKKFADKSGSLINGAMRYDTEKLEPLYQLEVGKPGSSFAFEIARKIGLHPSLINYAKGKVGVSQVDYDKMLNALESDKAKYEKLNNDLKVKEDELRILRDDYEAIRTMLELDRKRLIREAKVEAKGIVDGANKQVEKAIRVIKETNADKVKAKAVRNELKLLKESYQIDKQTRNETSSQLAIGDKVKIIGQEGVGEILTIHAKQASVGFGQLKSFVDLDRLEKLSTTQSKKFIKKRIGGIDITDRQQNFKEEIDLRGKRPEEALGLVDQFVDDGILIGSSNLRILHGKGQGVLRDIIRTHLRNDPNIVEMNDEVIERGGSGITVLKLK
jgi:DNA mismatch repair protein MutS2